MLLKTDNFNSDTWDGCMVTVSLEDAYAPEESGEDVVVEVTIVVSSDYRDKKSAAA